MGLFQRIFKVGQSQAHSLVDKLEDPIKMTEQGIRDLKNDLHKAMTNLARVKAIAIRHKKDSEDQKKLASEYERKAMMLLQKMQQGNLEPAEADRLASEALVRKEDSMKRAHTLSSEHIQQQKMADDLQARVDKLKTTIQRYENELVTLRARARTAESTRKINQQLSSIDSSSTIAMLEKMKDKVAEEESLAQAYGELSAVDEEIDKALKEPPTVKVSDSLAELKKKMGITK